MKIDQGYVDKLTKQINEKNIQVIQAKEQLKKVEEERAPLLSRLNELEKQMMSKNEAIQML